MHLYTRVYTQTAHKHIDLVASHWLRRVTSQVPRLTTGKKVDTWTKKMDTRTKLVDTQAWQRAGTRQEEAGRDVRPRLEGRNPAG
jgi:hypothetical protein